MNRRRRSSTRPRSTVRVTAIATVAALGLLLAGCGGGDTDNAAGNSTPSSSATVGSSASPTSPSTPSGTLTKQEFLDQANRICKVGNTVINASVSKLDITDKKVLRQVVADTLVPGIRQQIAGIRALGFPEGEEKKVSAALAEAEQALDALEADPTLISKGTAFTKANKALDAYGLTGCGSAG